MDDVTRAAKSSELSSRWSMTHDVAEPQMITRSFWPVVLRRFQNAENALRKSERCFASHGNSSMNTTAFPWGLFGASGLVMTLYSRLNASRQSAGGLGSGSPRSDSSSPNSLNWAAVSAFFEPTTWNAKKGESVCSTRYVLPTRRLPYTHTSSDLSEDSHRSSNSRSTLRPTKSMLNPFASSFSISASV